MSYTLCVKLCVGARLVNLIRYISVSYTHLDVYKRQTQYCKGERKERHTERVKRGEEIFIQNKNKAYVT